MVQTVRINDCAYKGNNKDVTGDYNYNVVSRNRIPDQPRSQISVEI